MCGIVGFITNNTDNFDYTEIIKKMTNQLSNRGPDGEGYYENKKEGYYLGHRRLSIIDLSDKGKQPMLSASKRYIITFNGEIYNHNILRSKLISNSEWISGSDTETILATFDRFGVEKSLQLFSGMFAIAVIDLKEEILYLARDFCGEKPLYYHLSDNNLIFSSQIKGLLSHPQFKKKINSKSLNYYFNLSYIPEPYTIFENTYKLEKGSILKYNIKKKIIEKISYFCPKILTDGYSIDRNHTDELNNILTDAIKISLTSDVEVGSFLSGGIDSSIVTAIMQSVSIKKIKTFSVAVRDKKYDESYFSRSISKYLDTDHHELVVDENTLLNQAKIIPEIYDEPFADSSQIPTSLISKFASSKLKVMLSGDGADEFFGGYNRYILSTKIHKLNKLFPYKIRVLLGKVINFIPEKMINIFESFLNKTLSKNQSYNQLYEKLKKFAVLLIECKSSHEVFLKIYSNYNDDLDFLYQEKNKFDQNEIDNFIESKLKHFSDKGTNTIEMYLDQNIYLSGDILHKIDRSSMFYGLENRSPFLNPSVIAFANNLPMNFKIKKNQGKWILRQVLKKHIPDYLIQKPKRGFAVPIDKWMRYDLKNWRNEILDPSKIKNQGFINYKNIKNILNKHDLKKKNLGSIIWNLVIWQSWIEKYNIN